MARKSKIPPAVVAAAQRAGLAGRRVWIPVDPVGPETAARDAALSYMAFRRAQLGRRGLIMATGVASQLWPELVDELPEMVKIVERTWIWQERETASAGRGIHLVEKRKQAS